MLNTMLADIFQISTLTRLIPSERIKRQVDSGGVVDILPLLQGVGSSSTLLKDVLVCSPDRQLYQVVHFSNVSPVKLLCGCVIIFMFEISIMCAGSSAE